MLPWPAEPGALETGSLFCPLLLQGLGCGGLRGVPGRKPQDLACTWRLPAPARAPGGQEAALCSSGHCGACVGGRRELRVTPRGLEPRTPLFSGKGFQDTCQDLEW